MSNIDPIPPLLARIAKYLEKTGEKPSKFGRKVANNSSLIDRLKDRSVHLKTVDKVVEYLDQQEAA